MHVKVDENLPAELASMLIAHGHEADTVPAEGLGGRPDEEVWTAVVRANRFLVTQDLDFSDVRRFVPGTHPGILLLRLEHPSRAALVQRMAQVLASEDIEAWQGCIAVATRHKIRIRRP